MKYYSNLDELKIIAIDAGIKNTHLMKEETLLNRLKEANIEVELEKKVSREQEIELEDDERLETDLKKSDELQENGWFVTEILRTGKDRPVIHKLKKMI